jgi:hypothetical protein
MLQCLSAELVELIARGLDDRFDLLRLRLACRYLYHATYAVFVAAWSTTLTTDLTPGSLRRLSSIARRHDLALAVRCLRIGDCGLPHEERYVSIQARERQVANVVRRRWWPRFENGCLDLASKQVVEFMAIVNHFALCAEIRVGDTRLLGR